MTVKPYDVFIYDEKGECHVSFCTDTVSASVEVCTNHWMTWLSADPKVTYPEIPERVSITVKNPSLIYHGPGNGLVYVPLEKTGGSELSWTSPNFNEFLSKLSTFPGCVCSPDSGNAMAKKILSSLPDLEDFDITCPSLPCNRYPRAASVSLWNLLIHLNDDHQWTREAIADWPEETAEENNLDLSFPTLEDPRDR